jgi:hypothetical protein
MRRLLQPSNDDSTSDRWRTFQSGARSDGATCLKQGPAFPRARSMPAS